MNTRFALLFSAACLLLSVGCSDDKKSGKGDGPAGSSEQLVGSWNLSSISMKISGKWYTVSAADADMTFNLTFSSGGTYTGATNVVDGFVSGTWNYNASNSNLYITEPGSEYNFHVTKLNDNDLGIRFDGLELDTEAAPIMEFRRASRAVQAASADAAASPEALRAALRGIVERSFPDKTDR